MEGTREVCLTGRGTSLRDVGVGVGHPAGDVSLHDQAAAAASADFVDTAAAAAAAADDLAADI